MQSIDLYADSPRGAGKSFGAKAVEHFCELHKLDCIVRAHQVVQEGYEFFANRKLVTIFSAPYYCQSTLNVAAVMNVDEKMVYEVCFLVFMYSFTSGGQILAFPATRRPSTASTIHSQPTGVGHFIFQEEIQRLQNHLVTFSNAISTIEMEKDKIGSARQGVRSASTIPSGTEPPGDKGRSFKSFILLFYSIYFK